MVMVFGNGNGIWKYWYGLLMALGVDGADDDDNDDDDDDDDVVDDFGFYDFYFRMID